MEFRLLGPLEVRAGGRTLDLGGLRQRRVLAALLLNADRVVALPHLIDAAWDDDPPATAQRQVQNRVGALRAVLTRAGRFIDTEGAGYRLRVDPDELDLLVFEELTRRGRAAADAGLLRQALGLWRGPALSGLGGDLLGRKAAALDEQHLAVWEECLELELAAGAHSRVVNELGALVAEHPLRERPVGLLMTALYRCGRQAEALSAYRELAHRLAEELGIDPSPELRRLQESVLRADPALDAPAPPAVAAPVVPAQLPADVWGFTGRVSDLARLDAMLSDGQAGRAVIISAIAGTAGVGKTALAVHWAHRVRDKFPDGQLYVNLRGFDAGGSVMSPAEAVRAFLDALRMPPEQVPASLEAQVGLYRSLLADKRMLLVLDNARDAEQVRPLLPGAPGCLVLITSRNQLTSLVAVEGAHPVTLDLLAPAEARELLVRRLGRDRVAAEPGAVDEIIDRCARLPLALAIAAARAVTNPKFPLAVLADELRQARGGLDAFAGEDAVTDVRAVLSWSYRMLGAPAARLFRLLGLHPGPSLAVQAAASLAGIPADEVRPLLAELVRAHLLAEPAPGRYTFHDLLRAYAGEQAHVVDSDDGRRQAAHRLLDHYLHTARDAALLVSPHRSSPELTAPRPGVTLVVLADARQATAWFDVEHRVLLAAVAQAEALGFDTHVWQLAWAPVVFQYARGYWQDFLAVQRRAVEATGRLADRARQGQALRNLASAYTTLGRFDDAHAHYRRALELAIELGDLPAQGLAHSNLSFLCNRQGDPREALRHSRQALELHRAAGDPGGQAKALNGIGWCHVLLGEYHQALPYCRQSVELWREIGSPHEEASALDSLGYSYHHLGRHDEAVDCYRDALAVFRKLGDRNGEADALAHLGDTHYAAGDRDRARDCWQRSLAIFTEIGHPEAGAVGAKLRDLG
jgi:DNA-binding SARP family transcriptional activator/Flp pilus assembly protein TadD